MKHDPYIAKKTGFSIVERERIETFVRTQTNSTPADFKNKIEEECIKGSGIEPDLYEATIEVVPDIEVLHGGEAIYPIHEALNWHLTRFGKKARGNLDAALFKNEDGSVWQAKLSRTFQVGKKPYLAPKDNGSRVFLPSVTVDIWYKVAKRYKLIDRLPPWVETAYKNGNHTLKTSSKGFGARSQELSFWHWIKQHLEIPLYLTEGGKKALCLLSNGYVAISLYGSSSGVSTCDRIAGERVRKLKPELIPDLQRFAAPGRKFILAFDQDKKPKTRRKVLAALNSLGNLLIQTGCEVSIAEWDQNDGKGIDDLIVNCGIEAWESALESALSFDQWQRQRYQELWKLSYKPELTLDQRYLEAISFPESGLVCVRSPKGTGKTQSLAPFIREASSIGRKALVITHRIQLGRAICDGIGVDWIEDVRESETQGLLGFGLCVDSLHENSRAKFNPDDWDGAIVILDEVEQVIWHLLNSATCKKERVKIIDTLRQLLRNVVCTGGLIIAQDADLSDVSINFLRGLIGEYAPSPWLVVNEWRDPSTAWDVHLIDTPTPSEALLRAGEYLDAGKRTFIACDAQKARSKHGSKNLEKYFAQKYPNKRILRIDSESVADPTHPAYSCAERINEVIKRFDIVIASPTLGTGVSIDIRGHFDAVFGIFQGATPESEARQALARVREEVPRHVWAKPMGVGSIGNGSQSPKELVRSTQRAALDNIRLLQQSDFLDLDWDSADPKIDTVCFKTWAEMAARINAGMPRYRETLAEALKAEGHNVVRVGSSNEDAAEKVNQEIKEIRIESQTNEALAVTEAEDIDDKQYETLKNKRAKVESERLQQRKHELQKRYGIEVSPDLHIKDEDGFYSKIRLHYLLRQHELKLAEQADASEINSALLGGNNKPLHLPDLNPRAARVQILVSLGIPSLIDPSRGEIRATDSDIQALVANLKAYRRTVKDVLGLSFSDKILETPIKALSLLLGKIGYRLQGRRVRSESGLERVYTVPRPDDERWEVFQAWEEKRNSVSTSDTVCSTSGYIDLKKSDSWNRKSTFPQNSEISLIPEDLDDIRDLYNSADSPEARNAIVQIFPIEMLRRAISA